MNATGAHGSGWCLCDARRGRPFQLAARDRFRSTCPRGVASMCRVPPVSASRGLSRHVGALRGVACGALRGRGRGTA